MYGKSTKNDSFYIKDGYFLLKEDGYLLSIESFENSDINSNHALVSFDEHLNLVCEHIYAFNNEDESETPVGSNICEFYNQEPVISDDDLSLTCEVTTFLPRENVDVALTTNNIV